MQPSSWSTGSSWRARSDDRSSRTRSSTTSNGDRLGNRVENLELWSTAQPKGQRVADKLAFAVALLERYAPELLAAPGRPVVPENAERPLPSSDGDLSN